MSNSRVGTAVSKTLSGNLEHLLSRGPSPVARDQRALGAGDAPPRRRRPDDRPQGGRDRLRVVLSPVGAPRRLSRQAPRPLGGDALRASRRELRDGPEPDAPHPRAPAPHAARSSPPPSRRSRIEILLDLFRWTNAVFEFDPTYRIEDLIRIHLSLRGQVLAFHGVKSLDETSKRPHRLVRRPRSGRALGARVPAGGRRCLVLVDGRGAPRRDAPRLRPSRRLTRPSRQFGEKIHTRLREPARLYPVYDDVAALLRDRSRRGGRSGAPRPDRRARPVPRRWTSSISRTPFAPTGRRRTASAREAAAAVGPEALRRLAGLLADPATPKVPAADRMEGLVRRSALSTAVAASHIPSAEEFSARGGLHARARRDPRKLRSPQAADQHPLPARADAGIRPRRFRAVFGRVLARKLNLPRHHEDVLGTTGIVRIQSSSSERLIFFAKQMILTDQIGPEWTSEDPALAERFASHDEGSGPPADDRPGRRQAADRPSALTPPKGAPR